MTGFIGGKAMRRLLPVALTLGMMTCQWVPLTAPVGSNITIFANPGFIPTNGGVSNITAIVTRPDGIIVSDGTVVYFFTTLGHIDEQAKTGGGIAHANLVSDSHSGVATVMAESGGPAQAPATTTPSTTPITTPSPSTSPTPSPSPSPGGGGTGGSTTGPTTTVTIGNDNAKAIIVTVSQPPKIVQGRPATITAFLSDADGNPAQNVPVIFSIGGTPSGLEGLASGSTPQFTDTSGQAFDTVFTKDDPSNPARAILVQAAVVTNGGILSAAVTVIVN
jgi:hypothetical protein